MAKSKRLYNVFAACLFFVCTNLYALNGIQVAMPAADGLIVKFKTNTSKSSQVHALSSSGVQLVHSFNLVPGLSQVQLLAGETMESALNALKSNPNVVYAEPDYYVSVDAAPSDPEFSLQWGLNNTGQTGGTSGADISAMRAWDLQKGNDVVIAVIDTGIDYNHPDLKNNVWVNTAEIPNNNVDDDANGFVDDYFGWDFNNDDNDPMDDMGHGTHVAGVIAAEANNQTGIVGVNWHARVMGLKFIDGNGVGTTSDAIKAINYAVMMGIRVSNNSWGGGGFSQALLDTLIAAQQADHLFIAASGNTGINTDDPANSPHYPSSYTLDNIIAVTASDEFDRKASFGNWGPVSVDIAAPGVQIRSLWLNNSYFNLDGTSMAAPFVTGAAGLLLASRPELTVAQLRSALLDNVDVLPEFNGVITTAGRLNLFKALSSVTTNLSLTPMELKMSLNNTVQFTASGGTAPYLWQVTNPAIGQINAQTGLFTPITTGVTQVTVSDANGFTTSSNDIVVDQITVTPENASLLVGQSLRFSARGGVPPYQWQSSNPRVASIDLNSGDLFAVAAGIAQVTVTDSSGLSTQTGNIEVVFIPDMVIAPQTLSLPVGDSFTFRAQGGIPPYTWSVENPLVASIDGASGVLTALSEGITRIAVKDSTGYQIFSGDIEVINVQVSVGSNTMRINETQALSVTGGTPPYEWRVSNSLVASVDNNGLLTALTPGSIKVTLMDSLGHVAATDVILVTNSSALAMSLSKTILGFNESLSINVSGGVQPYQWTVSDSTVLAINGNTNSVSAIGPGVSSITLTDAMGETIISPLVEVREIKISPEVSSYYVNDQVQFVATGGVAPYNWQVSSQTVAAIDSTGLFVANRPGIVTVTATDVDGVSGQSQTISITTGGQVSAHPFEVTPMTAVLSRRSSSTLKFVATGGVEPYHFSLSTSGVGSIDPVTGEFNPKSNTAGDTTVVVTDADGHVTESGIISVR